MSRHPNPGRRGSPARDGRRDDRDEKYDLWSLLRPHQRALFAQRQAEVAERAAREDAPVWPDYDFEAAREVQGRRDGQYRRGTYPEVNIVERRPDLYGDFPVQDQSRSPPAGPRDDQLPRAVRFAEPPTPDDDDELQRQLNLAIEASLRDQQGTAPDRANEQTTEKPAVSDGPPESSDPGPQETEQKKGG